MADMLSICPCTSEATKGTGEGGPEPYQSNDREAEQEIEDFERVE